MIKLASIGIAMKHCLRSLLFWGLAGLVVGYYIASSLIPRPQVAIISLYGVIGSNRMADEVLQMLNYAKETRAIRAVVLEINSPGGAAPLAEDIYWHTTDLRREKPVVTHVKGQALSGGYYVAAASDYIFVEASAMVGNVGVWVRLPESEQPSETLVPTGPLKEAGSSARGGLGWLEMVKQSFVRSVVAMRGERLKLTLDELSKAAVYLGIEGVQYGLVDEIGSSGDAVRKAASIARLRHYVLADLRQELGLRPAWYWVSFQTSEGEKPESPSHTLPRFYYQYPPGE